MKICNHETTHDARRRASLTTRWWIKFGILVLTLAATAIASPAQEEQPSNNTIAFTTLFSFDGTNGGNPTGPLVQGVDGNLYGTTFVGGTGTSCSGLCGTFFRISPGGALTTLYNFCPEGLPCAESGGETSGGLTLGIDGNFYGITSYGGANGFGTLFKITPAGALTTLYNWCSQVAAGGWCVDGQDEFLQSQGGLAQDSYGNLYGATSGGGNGFSDGTIFKLAPNGALTTLYSFCAQSNCPDGYGPSGLIQGSDGSFYGTTYWGGANGSGTVYKITPEGALTTVYSFCSKGGSACTDGGLPLGALTEGLNGNLYGTTSYAGNGVACVPFGNCGTVFEITPGGDLTTVYNFCSQTNCEDGSSAAGPLVQGTDRNFYGETSFGGASGDGTLFKLTPEGVLTTLQSFDAPNTGTVGDGVVQATNGYFYGPTFNGGSANSSLCFGSNSTCGTVFRLSAGLVPFVETLPPSGKSGQQIKILGTDLTGATGVTFNGTAAVFKVISKTLISATVPAGATTGFVTVTTSGKTLKSNVKFQVRP
jgi:uncharacterized repeat protein (TIGR03803 family)